MNQSRSALIVDDERDIRELLTLTLGRMGLRRVFAPQVLERLALISLGRAAGFSLDEMSGMFAPDGRPRIDKRLLVAKADELDRTIRKLSAIREGLRHAAVCRAPSHMECPTFQRILRTTAARKPRPARKPPR